MKKEHKENKYVYVSDKHKFLEIKWDTGWQYFEFIISVDDLLDADLETNMEMKIKRRNKDENNKND